MFRLLKRIIKKFYPGVSWHSPVFNFLFKLIDPVDYSARLFNGTSHFPKYSMRVRSNGVNGQFGGKNFKKLGELLVGILSRYAKLDSKSEVLEIGCGCGRNAFALSGILNEGTYLGLDIDRPSWNAAKKNSFLKRKGNFSFEYLNVQNDEYNPNGVAPASTYKFELANDSFDVIFMVSVFTHMLTDDVKNYIKEISRMMKPGSVCMITTFLMDRSTGNSDMKFNLKDKDHYYFNETIPEIAVAYQLDFYKNEFKNHGLEVNEPLWGAWRKSDDVESISGFSQDIIFAIKQ